MNAVLAILIAPVQPDGIQLECMALESKVSVAAEHCSLYITTADVVPLA
jgi:hypothetical protein